MSDFTYIDLRTTAEMLEDAQKSRISNENRVRSATVVVMQYEPVLRRMRDIEKELSDLLVVMYREVVPASVVAWQEATPGVGAHLLARLLGHLGDPRRAAPKFWAESPDGEHGDEANPKRALQDGDPFDRTVGQLWQYCGHGRAARRAKGMSQQDALALGNPRCKMLVHLICDGVVKRGVRGRCLTGKSTFEPKQAKSKVCLHCGAVRSEHDSVGVTEGGVFFLAEKAKYASRVHTAPCSGGYVSAGPGKVVFAKCKHDGHYAEAGDPYQPGHINAIAMRHLGKELLKQLWVAAGEAEDRGHSSRDVHHSPAPSSAREARVAA